MQTLWTVGDPDGDALGVTVGDALGAKVGATVGLDEGAWVFTVGAAEGS